MKDEDSLMSHFHPKELHAQIYKKDTWASQETPAAVILPAAFVLQTHIIPPSMADKGAAASLSLSPISGSLNGPVEVVGR